MNRVLLPLTIFLSAFLLFQVQPIMGRYILPWFGGTPAVWSVCLLFFQAMLLADTPTRTGCETHGFTSPFWSFRWRFFP